MSDTLAYLRRDKAAALEPVALQNDYILSRDGAPPGLENETYWFTFEVPERGLLGNVYIWVHSQLRTSTAFVLIFEGVKRYVWQAEHFNCYCYLPYPTVTDDSVIVPELGVQLRIIEPHVRHEIRYDEPRTRTHLHLHTRALLPPVKAVGRAHLEQPMHVTGEMMLNGVTHPIDCFSMRDRSWRGKRPERAEIHPPSTYANGISRDGSVVFNFNGADDPDKGVSWAGRYNIARSDLLLEGWVHRHGKLAKVVSMSKTSQHDRNDFMRQTAWTCELNDELGRTHVIRARRQAALPFAPWASLYNDWGHFAFEMDDGTTGYAITNDFFFNEYARTIETG